MGESKPTIAEVKAIAQANYAEQLSDAQKRLDFSVGYAQAGLKSLFLVNGASLVALLTFIGNDGVLIEVRAIFLAFVWFTLGLASALIAYFGAYFSQAYFMQVSIAHAWNAQAIAHGFDQKSDGENDRKKGSLSNAIAVVAAAISLLFFVIGAFVALDAIT